MTAQQNKIFHALISALKISKDNKMDMIYGVSNGRTATSKELTKKEVQHLIDTLKSQSQKHHKKANQLRRTLLKLGYDCGWKKEQTIRFIEKKGGKGFNAYHLSELMKWIKIMERVASFYMEKSNNNNNNQTEDITYGMAELEALITTAKNCTNYA